MGMLFPKLVGGILFAEIVGAAGDLLCCNGRTDNMLKVGLD
jgi:hypothetical protein